MLKSFFSKILILFSFILVGLFAFSNPDYISLGIWPLEERLLVPLYFIVIFVFTLGFILGRIYRIFKKNN